MHIQSAAFECMRPEEKIANNQRNTEPLSCQMQALGWAVAQSIRDN